MKIELDPMDLKPKYQENSGTPAVDQNLSTSQIRFAHLNERAQQVVTAAGCAVFRAWDRLTYNVIYPPKGDR